MKNLNVDGGWETSLMQVKGWHELQRYFFFVFFPCYHNHYQAWKYFSYQLQQYWGDGVPESSPAYLACGPSETQRAPVEAVDDGVPPVSQTLCPLMILP